MTPQQIQRTPAGRLLLAAMVMIFIPGAAMAATNGTLTVQWDENTTDGDLAGYRVYLTADPAVFNLTPAQAQAVATTTVVNPGTSQTIFTGLDTAQVYWAAVTAFDTSGNESGFSNMASGQPADINAPTVSITAPADGATVSGSINVAATAADDIGVAGVQFKLDGADFGAEDTSAPYEVTWDTTAAADGSHTLTAVARDAAGNVGTSAAVTVTVDNIDTTAPTVSITQPSGGAIVSASVTISASASDDTGVAGVQFRLDGVDLGAEDTTAPYEAVWDTTAGPNGSHTLTAIARDAAGNSTISAAVTVTVDNPDVTPPVVSITSPLDGLTVSGTIDITAVATDDVAMGGVMFQVDGANLPPEDKSNPYSKTWDSTSVADGTHTLTAVARDAAGNTTVSAVITVTVSNADTTPPSPPTNVRIVP